MPAAPAVIAAWVSAAAAVAGAGVSAYSMVKAGEAQEDTAKYNAEMQRREAQDALQRGAMEAANKQDKARRVAAQQVEGAAMSGVSTNTGTPLALLTETAGIGELDSLRTINNAHRAAYGMNAQATLDEFQGAAARRAGYLNAGGTMLTATSNVADKVRSYYGKAA